MIVKNVTLLGHKDHGKSTLIGQMLIQTKTVTQDRINEAKKISENLGRPFEPGFILDSFSEERENAMTIDTTRAELTYKGLAFEFIDVPGHEELIKNMISGASYAEFAVLLVSAAPEEGIRDQTKRHLFLARMLGIKKLIVAVNKMDMIKYDQEAFNGITADLSSFIRNIGFDEGNATFVPISAYSGDNILEKSANMQWYTGRTLLDALYDSAESAESNVNPSLRVLVQGKSFDSENGIMGKVLCGEVKVGTRVVALPESRNYTVKEIVSQGEQVQSAHAGDNVDLEFDGKVDEEVRGSVVADETGAPSPSDEIIGKLFVTKRFNGNTLIKANGNEMRCKINIEQVIDPTTGNAIKDSKPEELQAAIANIKLEKKAVFEKSEKVPELGRFLVYSDNEFAGIGIVE